MVYLPEAELSTWYAVGLFNWTETDYQPVYVEEFDEIVGGDYLNYRTITRSSGLCLAHEYTILC